MVCRIKVYYLILLFKKGINIRVFSFVLLLFFWGGREGRLQWFGVLRAEKIKGKTPVVKGTYNRKVRKNER